MFDFLIHKTKLPPNIKKYCSQCYRILKWKKDKNFNEYNSWCKCGTSLNLQITPRPSRLMRLL